MAEERARILVVEDDSAIRDTLVERLTQYELVFATCQTECYAQLESLDFDLVLLDLKLPRVPGELAATSDVGIDILDWIRNEEVPKRGSEMLLQVMVMTAFGYDPVDTIAIHGAVYYIRKPFGEDLEDKIRWALEGAGPLLPARNLARSGVELAFHPSLPKVRVAGFEYGKKYHQLLSILCELFVKDRTERRRLHAYRGLTGLELAHMMERTDKTVRQRITSFRRDVARDFASSLGRTLDNNDIIENMRQRDGYRLNPHVVHIVDW